MKYVLMHLVMRVLDVHFLLGISTYIQAVLASKTHLAEGSAVAHWWMLETETSLINLVGVL
jgi:hypothetical protein